MAVSVMVVIIFLTGLDVSDRCTPYVLIPVVSILYIRFSAVEIEEGRNFN